MLYLHSIETDYFDILLITRSQRGYGRLSKRFMTTEEVNACTYGGVRIYVQCPRHVRILSPYYKVGCSSLR